MAQAAASRIAAVLERVFEVGLVAGEGGDVAAVQRDVAAGQWLAVRQGQDDDPSQHVHSFGAHGLWRKANDPTDSAKPESAFELVLQALEHIVPALRDAVEEALGVA